MNIADVRAGANERVLARAKQLCRMPDGSECQGPGNDCDADNCFAFQQAEIELKPGWLMRDIKRAQARLKEWGVT